MTGRARSAHPADLVRAFAEIPSPPPTSTRLLIGPANFAGQGRLWAQAVGRNISDAGAISFAVPPEHGFGFAADYLVSPSVYHRSRQWQHAMFTHVTAGFTHVLIEAERPLFGELFRMDPFLEAKRLLQEGLAVAMIGHGTDVRLPSRHAAAHPWSPFRDTEWPELHAIEARAARNLAAVATAGLPYFVSTPDLLDDVPMATWCPVVVDTTGWPTPVPLLGSRPTVLHMPSSGRLKSTDRLDQELGALHAEGLVQFRRTDHLLSSEVPSLLAGVDIVLDQFRLGSYGVAACEAMALGRVVVGNVTESVRATVRKQTGLDLPIVQAVESELGEVLRTVLADPERVRQLGIAGVDFVRHVHDGRWSAARLRADFLAKVP